jgi:hypothetical protein
MAMLLALLIVIAVVQVLPQVDLPDTAFHEDTAPIVIKTRAASAPTLALAIQDTLLVFVQAVSVIVGEASLMPAHPLNRSLSILFSTLLC